MSDEHESVAAVREMLRSICREVQALADALEQAERQVADMKVMLAEVMTANQALQRERDEARKIAERYHGNLPSRRQFLEPLPWETLTDSDVPPSPRT